MARNRKKKESLVYQVQKNLESKLAIGELMANDKAQEAYLLREMKKDNPKAQFTYEERITPEQLTESLRKTLKVSSMKVSVSIV